MDFLQEGMVYISDIHKINETTAICISPDISSSFNDYADQIKEAFVTINDLDGVFRKENSLMFTYIRDYGLTEVIPPYTYMKQQQTITLKGINLLNVYSLIVKMVLDVSKEVTYF